MLAIAAGLQCSRDGLLDRLSLSTRSTSSTQLQLVNPHSAVTFEALDERAGWSVGPAVVGPPSAWGQRPHLGSNPPTLGLPVIAAEPQHCKDGPLDRLSLSTRSTFPTQLQPADRLRALLPGFSTVEVVRWRGCRPQHEVHTSSTQLQLVNPHSAITFEALDKRAGWFVGPAVVGLRELQPLGYGECPGLVDDTVAVDDTRVRRVAVRPLTARGTARPARPRTAWLAVPCRE